MKVLLVQPPVQDFYDTDVRLQPIGLCYLKAAVNKHLPEVEVIIKDFHAGCGRKTVKIPQETSIPDGLLSRRRQIAILDIPSILSFWPPLR
jgi:hypothetical protein